MELPSTSNRGVITLEILLAMTLLVLAISEVLPLVAGQQSLLTNLQNYHQAMNVAQEQLITMQSITKNPNTATQCAVDAVSLATVGRAQVSFTKRLVSFDEFLALGKDCQAQALDSNSQTVHVLEKIPLATGQTFTGIDVLNDVVFVSVVGGAPDKPDLFAWQEGWPEALGINTGLGLNGLDVVLDENDNVIIYVARNETQNQLEIFEFNGNVFTFLAGANLEPAPLGSNSMALSITYYDQKVYVGTGYLPSLSPNPIRPEFQAFEVKIPWAPKFLGSFDVNHNINSIALTGSVAYLATSDDVGELWELDVSRPEHISFLKKVDFARKNDGYYVQVLGGQVILKRSVVLKDQENNITYVP